MWIRASECACLSKLIVLTALIKIMLPGCAKFKVSKRYFDSAFKLHFYKINPVWRLEVGSLIPSSGTSTFIAFPKGKRGKIGFHWGR